MKVRIVQKNISNTDCRPFLEDAENASVDLICFGELATTGCLYVPRSVDSLDALTRSLRAYNLRIMIGLPYHCGDHLHNSYLYFHRGSWQLYHKTNLFPQFGEPDVYQAGTEPGLWETDFGRVGVAICYDIRFPDIFANFRRMGAEKIFVPAAFPRVRIDDWRRLLVLRARETNATVIGINSVGDDGRHEFGGSSMVVSPLGEVLAQADETAETVLETTL